MASFGREDYMTRFLRKQSKQRVKVKELDLLPQNSGLIEQLEAEKGKYCVAFSSGFSLPATGIL